MIDFDGVLADLESALVAGCNEKFSTNYTVEEVDDWHWWSRQPKQFADYVWKVLYPDRDWFYERVHPYPGAIEALADLLTDGEVADKVVIVTARHRDHLIRVQTWLYNQGVVGLDAVPVLAIGRSYPKSHYCQIERLNIVVDDGVHNVNGMHPERQRSFLIERPWNAQAFVGPHVSRVPELQAAVNAIAGEDRKDEE